MLVNLMVENFKSFDDKVKLSMLSSTKIQGNKEHRLKIKQTHILKNAVIYGANASGKSNLVATFSFIKYVLEQGLPVNASNDFCKIKEENKNKESVFELQFTVNDTFYAYGFSAILNQRKITEEWLYELFQDGTSRNLFVREGSSQPKLGETIKLSAGERNRFKVYAEDFIGNDTKLFLSEMNRGKQYDKDSKLYFFYQVFDWLDKNIIIIKPNMGISSSDTYYSEESLNNVTKLIQTFDTGITDIKTKVISIEEMSKNIPADLLKSIFSQLQEQMQLSNFPDLQITWRISNGFYNIHLRENEEPEITTLVLKHSKSFFEFDFEDESDGTKRLFDLVDMIMTKRGDTVFIVDELERSLHPKLTEHFLELFMRSHLDERVQLVFTTHEDTIMNQNIF
ncbi:MAG: ATP-binding protein, partial [Clostridia bacterium]|nr:ATP-binding protein [Clostridia bacterium]